MMILLFFSSRIDVLIVYLANCNGLLFVQLANINRCTIEIWVLMCIVYPTKHTGRILIHTLYLYLVLIKPFP
jgi:hypothetical protein